jgi:hypothetical protein
MNETSGRVSVRMEGITVEVVVEEVSMVGELLLDQAVIEKKNSRS